jgi:hypothetical protein
MSLSPLVRIVRAVRQDSPPTLACIIFLRSADSPRGCTPLESCPAPHVPAALRLRLYANAARFEIELASDLNPCAVIVSLS